MKNKKPLFIAVEGGEGSGKSSILKAYVAAHPADLVLVTREPGGSTYGEAIREVTLKHPLAHKATPQTTMCLMFASRFDHLAHKIIPALKEGKTVWSDRFDASSYAYNVWAQTKGRLEDMFWAMRDQLEIKPDLYIFFDVETETGLRRAHARNAVNPDGNHFDDKKIPFHRLVREGYLRFLSHVPHVTINANPPFEAVLADFTSKVAGF